MFDPSPAGISYIPFAQAKSNLLIAGLDFRPYKLVHFIPNVEYVFYDDTDGSKPDSDLYLRLTFYYKFNMHKEQGKVSDGRGDCKQSIEISPYAVEVMREIGIDISHQKPKSIDVFKNEFLTLW